MADSATFEWVCNELEQRTSLDRLEARGTVRLSLKQAGLEPGTVTTEQMKVVLEKVLPSELDSRGVDASLINNSQRRLIRVPGIVEPLLQVLCLLHSVEDLGLFHLRESICRFGLSSHPSTLAFCLHRQPDF